MSDDDNIGPTRLFPKGQLNADDEGGLECRIGVNIDRQRIIIEFGTQLSWIGFTAATAESFSKAIMACVDQLNSSHAN
jgi:hypothetical protein